MSLLLAARHRDMQPFKQALAEVDPDVDVEIWPEVKKPERVQMAVAWRHPKNIFGNYPNLQLISSLGAGTDHLFADSTIPEHLRFSRLVIPSLSDQMCDYILASVLNILRKTDLCYDYQKRGEWNKVTPYLKRELSVGVMGIGELGAETAKRISANGFRVSGWSRSKKVLDGVRTFSSGELDTFLSETNILACLLPLTPETEGILDLSLFKKLKKPAFLINAARGEHLVEEDLIYALDTGLISHAVLDVFTEEPLPSSHAFWGRKKITITPHIASVTDPDEAARLLADNYKRLLSGMDLLYEVDRKRGY